MQLKDLSVPDNIRRLNIAELKALPARKRHKYNAKPTVVDGIRYDSALEARRWFELKLLERQGLISELQRQRAYPLEVNGILVTTYVADYVYREGETLVVEDAKGDRPREYRIKAKLMKAVYGITIRETGAGHLRGVRR